MVGGEQRRYPTEYFTRDRIGPTETARAMVLDRDERTCLARTWFEDDLGNALVVRTAAADPTGERATRPLFLRTFCSEHADLDLSPSRRIAWDRIRIDAGWLIPAVDDPAAYARRLPVLYPGGRWFLLDDWGDREQLSLRDATRLRLELRKEHP